MTAAGKPRTDHARRSPALPLLPPSRSLPLVGMTLPAGFGPGVAGFAAGFKGSPSAQTPQAISAGQTSYEPPFAGFAGLEVRSYAREKTGETTVICRVRACVGIGLGNPQTPHSMIKRVVACTNTCGVWGQRNPARNPAASAANPAAQSQPNLDPDGRRPR